MDLANKGAAVIGILLMMQTFAVPCLSQSYSGADTVGWYKFEDIADVKNDMRPIFLFMEARWCGICKRMHREVFTDPEVIMLLKDHFYPVKIDIESGSEVTFKGDEITQKALSKHLKLQATPTLVFLEPDHTIIGRKPGFVAVEELKIILRYISSDSWKQMSLQEFQSKQSRD